MTLFTLYVLVTQVREGGGWKVLAAAACLSVFLWFLVSALLLRVRGQ